MLGECGSSVWKIRPVSGMMDVPKCTIKTSGTDLPFNRYLTLNVQSAKMGCVTTKEKYLKNFCKYQS